jgi:hypothetical protein
MNHLMKGLGIFACVVVITLASRMQAVEVVSLTGTSFTENEFEAGRFRVKSAPMTLKTIYAAAGVSRTDYVLESDGGGTNFLYLRPRANTNLATIILIQSPESSARYLRDWTVGGHTRQEKPLNGPSNSVSLFNDFRGTAYGRLGLATPTEGLIHASYEVMGSSSTHMMKFRFKIDGHGPASRHTPMKRGL